MKESGEMYLETILVLKKEKGNVRAIDVCRAMNFSKPSVSRALAKLKADSYISVSDDGLITLTGEGLKIAESIYERHIVLSTLLKKLGVSEETAINDACKMEHDISEESFLKIKEHMMLNSKK